MTTRPTAAGDGRCAQTVVSNGSTTTSTSPGRARRWTRRPGRPQRPVPGSPWPSPLHDPRGYRQHGHGHGHGCGHGSGNGNALSSPPPSPDPQRHTGRGGVGGARRGPGQPRQTAAAFTSHGVQASVVKTSATTGCTSVAAHAARRPHSPGGDTARAPPLSLAAARTARQSRGRVGQPGRHSDRGDVAGHAGRAGPSQGPPETLRWSRRRPTGSPGRPLDGDPSRSADPQPRRPERDGRAHAMDTNSQPPGPPGSAPPVMRSCTVCHTLFDAPTRDGDGSHDDSTAVPAAALDPTRVGSARTPAAATPSAAAAEHPAHHLSGDDVYRLGSTSPSANGSGGSLTQVRASSGSHTRRAM